MNINPIVSPKWLLARMYEPDLVIVDCRFVLGSPESGQAAYAVSHIPGAVFLDIEEDLSAPVGPHGGRHPLPEPQELAARLGRAGISNASRVVAYDDQGACMQRGFGGCCAGWAMTTCTSWTKVSPPGRPAASP